MLARALQGSNGREQLAKRAISRHRTYVDSPITLRPFSRYLLMVRAFSSTCRNEQENTHISVDRWFGEYQETWIARPFCRRAHHRDIPGDSHLPLAIFTNNDSAIRSIHIPRHGHFPEFSSHVLSAPRLHWRQSAVQTGWRILSAPPLVTIRHFSIAAHYLDLLFRPGYIARIVLNDFHIHVPAERLSLERPPTDSSKSSILVGEIIADGSSIQIDRDSDSPLLFDIHTLRLAPASESTPFSYTTTLHIPLPSGELRSNGKFGPWNLNNPGQTAVSGEFAFENADLGVFKGIAGTLSSEAKFQGVLSNIEAHGKINIPNFGVTRSHHSVHLQSAFHAYIDGTNGDVRLEHVEASYFKTKVTAEGEVAHHSGQDGKIASIDLFVSNGRIQDVLYLFVRAPDPPLHGLASFRAHVSIPPKAQPFVEKIRIIGDFEIENGQFAKASTQESIDTLSERARGVKPENENDSDKVISDLAGHVDLRNASAALTDLRFHVPGASAHMDGTYNIESTKINLHGTLRTDEIFPSDHRRQVRAA